MNNGDRPAHPLFSSSGNPKVLGTILEACATGLTKREVMAIAAMQGILSGGMEMCEYFYGIGDTAPEASVKMADALLKALEGE